MFGNRVISRVLRTRLSETLLPSSSVLLLFPISLSLARANIYRVYILREEFDVDDEMSELK